MLRIEACYALGLISDREHHDLDLLRKIRNDFAHDIHTSFDSQPVIDRCAQLKMKAHDYTSKDRGEVVIPPRGQFETAAIAVIMHLISRPHYVSEVRRENKEWAF